MGSMDCIYFGGAFDPIHLGHVDSVKIAHEAFPDAKIIVVPGLVVPVAGGSVKTPVTSFVDRVAMAVIAFDDATFVDVSSLEEELPTPNYTYQTVEIITRDLPAERVGWMIGADQLLTFTEWKNARRILELVSLVIIPRPSTKIENTLELAQSVATHLGFSVRIDVDHHRIDLDGGGSIHVMTNEPRSISSSEIRRLAADNLKKIEDLVPTAVIEYIADLNLYQQLHENSNVTTEIT
jgi:nicotinate-nucleotide adenylyltransferase